MFSSAVTFVPAYDLSTIGLEHLLSPPMFVMFGRFHLVL